MILDIDQYQEMLEQLDDLEDLQALRRMRAKPLTFGKLEDILKGCPTAM